MKKIFLILLLLISTLFSTQINFNSGENRVNLIELYTSEGCSSCPAADIWLSNLKNNPKLFKEFIPMAFHVTYWDFIGWKDTFAHELYDNRQRYYSSNVWKKNSVYTPQFIINAQEYKQWFYSKSFPSFKNRYGGNLSVVKNGQQLEINFLKKEIKNEKVYVNVAILGFDYQTKVKSGENENKMLKHDFVVLEHYRDFSTIKNEKLQVNTLFPKVKKDKHKKALVVWISDSKNSILQATGGYL